jgi:hypothetical protein
MSDDPKLKVVHPDPEPAEPIRQPGKFSLNKFKSTQTASSAGVETLLTALPHYPLAQAKDFVRLHQDEDKYWSAELCFVSVPIKGQKTDTLHLIDEGLAKLYLPHARVQRFRLALATKPNDVFFLCHVPSQALDNSWNASNLQACEQAKMFWMQAISQKAENIEAYKLVKARDQDAFPSPNWLTQPLENLIEVTFTGCLIETANNPALLRLIGAKPSVS